MADGFFESTQVRTTDLRNMMKNFKEVVWTHNNVPATIKGVFINEFEAVSLGISEVESAKPVLLVCDADIPAAANGDTIVISGTTYYIRGIQPDGTGMTMLVLSKD